jgi:glycosyltransferase involved in cell wall biosynthesis
VAAAPDGVSVHHLPLPLVTPVVDAAMTKEHFGLDDRFTFLFMFDAMSVLKRKNPVGLIAAYRDAFTQGDGVRLVLKSMNGQTNPEGLEHLYWRARDRPDITILDATLDQTAAASLMNVSDCYVSLHRSEGLGLTMADAMLLGKPVIATGYSGNMDFMNDRVAHLVRWSPTAVGTDAGPYDPGATWAEPDHDHAVELLQQVVGDLDGSRTMGSAAQQWLTNNFSAARCGAAMRARLETIWRN